MSCLQVINNELAIENCRLTDIADQFGTPCYVYSTKQIKDNWSAFANGFQGLATHICYAVKANSNLSILRLLAECGAGFDIVSLGELERVLLAGGDAQKVIFSGVGKSAHDIESAIKLNVGCFNIESEPELQRINHIANKLQKKVKVALRINPDVEADTHAHITTGLKENKFGIDPENLPAICHDLTQMPNIIFIGIAAHIGSQITELQPFLQMVDKLLGFYDALKPQHPNLAHINIGGGLGITYHQETPPTIHAYATAIKQTLMSRQIECRMEPGRAIIANAGVLLTRIEYIKHTSERKFAIVDAGMNDLLRPALYDAWQPILPVVVREMTNETYDIVGPVCESADVFAKNRQLAIEDHDLLAIDVAGAYGFSMSSNYNSRPKAAEVLIDGHHATLIRRRETITDMVQAEQIHQKTKDVI